MHSCTLISLMYLLLILPLQCRVPFVVLSLMFTGNFKFQVQSGKPREPAQESQLSMQGFEFGIESDWSKILPLGNANSKPITAAAHKSEEQFEFIHGHRSPYVYFYSTPASAPVQLETFHHAVHKAISALLSTGTFVLRRNCKH